MADIYNLLSDVTSGLSTEYQEKMMHPIPAVKVVDRAALLIGMAKGKVILDVGATGDMSLLLQASAKEYHGIDITPNEKVENYYQLDLDNINISHLPRIEGLNIIIAGEVIEHLSNAGHFLDLLHFYNVPVVLTTPNAFSIAGIANLKNGIENVNKEHVAWYSYHTLKVLIERHNFELATWFWYNGKPLTAEGLIFIMRPC